MTSFPKAPKLFKAGMILVHTESDQMQCAISLQHNADSLSRQLPAQATAGEGGGQRIKPTRYKGPGVETYSLVAKLVATDQIEFTDQRRYAGAFDIQPQFALLDSPFRG